MIRTMLRVIQETFLNDHLLEKDYPRQSSTIPRIWPEVCARTADPQITMHWIKEVEIAKSFDEVLTSRTDFPDFDMLDAMIASALKKLLNTQIHFRKRVSVEEQRAQTHDRFLRGRQIAYMIYEYFRATRACEAVQGLSDLFTFSLQNDDVQDFDVRWDHDQLSVSEMPSDMILGRIVNSAQLQSVLALYYQKTARNKGIKDSCNTSY